MKIVGISDTHGAHKGLVLPDGDVLIHAGDITVHGTLNGVVAFNDWIGRQPHKHKIVIAGNHDFCFEDSDRLAAEAFMTNATYLRDSGCEIDGIKFWGTPWQPWFHDWAFNVGTEKERQAIWDLIPKDTDVLIVHGPPYGYGDLCMSGDRPGCKALKKTILESKIKLVITGHIHEDYGEFDMDGVRVVNASIMNVHYKPVNKPIVIEM